METELSCNESVYEHLDISFRPVSTQITYTHNNTLNWSNEWIPIVSINMAESLILCICLTMAY